MKPKVSFLKHLYDNQPGQYISLSRRTLTPDGQVTDSWRDFFFTTVDEVVEWIQKQPRDVDVYFCPTKLNDKRRRKANVENTKFLYADLDEADPHTFAEAFRPTIAWESSPNRYQCLWELETPIPPADAEAKNKFLAYKLGADTGGWDLTQVLRVPGTYNNKPHYRRDGKQPRVKLLWSNGAVRKPDFYQGILSTESIAQISSKERRVKLQKLLADERDLKPSTRRILLAAQAIGDRSLMLYRLSHELVEAGVARDKVLQVLLLTVWNKFRGREREEELIRSEVDKAFRETSPLVRDERARERLAKKGSRGAGEDEEEDTNWTEVDTLYAELKKRQLSTKQLLVMDHRPEEWLVEDWWPSGSYGIVAGPAKSLKSTLLWDLAVAVATGTEFLDKYQVLEQGPVIYYQAEGSIMDARDKVDGFLRGKEVAPTPVFGKVKNGVLRVDDFADIFDSINTPLYIVNNPPIFLDDDVCVEAIRRQVETIKPILLIFDPFYLMFRGNLNSQETIMPALQSLKKLAIDNGCSLIIAHHTNKASQRIDVPVFSGGAAMLGSVLLHGWVDSAWYLKPGKPQEGEESGTLRVSVIREFRSSGAGLGKRVDIHIPPPASNDGKYVPYSEVKTKGAGDDGPDKKKPAGRPRLDTKPLMKKTVELLQSLPNQSAKRSKIKSLLGVSNTMTTRVLNQLIASKKVEMIGSTVIMVGAVRNGRQGL